MGALVNNKSGSILSNLLHRFCIQPHWVKEMLSRKKREDVSILRTEQEVLRVQEEILRETRELRRQLEHLTQIILHPPHRSKSAAVQFSGDTKMPNNALVLNVGQTSTASPITFLADGTTPSGATYSNAVYSFSDPSATVVLNPDGITAVCTGVAPSNGPISGSVTFVAVDTDSAQSTWTQTFTIQTNAVTPPPPSQLSQSAAVTFSDPV